MSTRVNILVVDDQPANVVALQAILDRPDYELVTASSGTDALRQSLRHEFAVILLDVMMPDMDGFEVAAMLRGREATRSTPIIFLSATGTDVSYSSRGYEVGAVDYLAKPSDPDVVRAKVAVFVDLFRKNQQIKEQEQALRAVERREQALKVAELQLRNERRYRNLAEAIPQIVWVAAVDGGMEYMNGKWRELTAEGEYRGWRWVDHVAVEDRDAFRARWDACLRAGEPFSLECRLVDKDGTSRWHLCRGTPERHHDRLVDWLGTFTDIHEQKMEEARAQAEVQKRDEFLLIASHELNTPLTSLQLQLQRIERSLEKNAMNAVRDGLEVANRSTKRLTNLVQLLLDTSRITAGRLHLEKERVDLSALARDVATRLADEAQRAGTPIEMNIDGELCGEWDRNRIDQVVTNLITNAIKYGDRKPVEVITRPDGDSALFIVRDRGIGIKPEDQKRIFERFTRAVSERNFGGLGLGLYIVGQIVGAHGGNISVASTVGEGTTFTVSLPRS